VLSNIKTIVVYQMSTNVCPTKRTTAASTPRVSTHRATIYVNVSPDIVAMDLTVTVNYDACRSTGIGRH
jgi:hypothetical protein